MEGLVILVNISSRLENSCDHLWISIKRLKSSCFFLLSEYQTQFKLDFKTQNTVGTIVVVSIFGFLLRVDLKVAEEKN